ncbi:hypothetical protein [Caldisericum sp.]|uniref:hypothetical protein n=1 Tax=Caldisericum sp. TaxID=2499687 RepID=UPI003D0F3557
MKLKENISFFFLNSSTLFFILLIIILSLKVVFIVYPDLPFSYPFMSYDSFEWIADGLFYYGHPVPIIYRDIALPIILGAFNQLDILRWFPMVNELLFFLFITFSYLLLRQFFPKNISIATTLVIFLSFNIQSYFDYILADQWAITFQTISFYFLIKTKYNSKNIKFAIIFASISFLFQYAIGFLFIAYLYLLLSYYKRFNLDKRQKKQYVIHLTIGICIGFILIFPYFLYKFIKFHNPLYSGVTQFSLVKPHLYGIMFYLIGYFSFFGLIFGIIGLYGFLSSIKKHEFFRFVLIGFLSYILFWVFLYEWLETRFILYLVTFISFYIAEGLLKIFKNNILLPQYESVKIVLIILILIPGFFCLLFPRDNPFQVNILPITFDRTISFKTKPLSPLPKDLTIDFNNIAINKLNSWQVLKKIINYYPEHLFWVNHNMIAHNRYLELKQISDMIPQGDYSIADCTINENEEEHNSLMRKIIIFQRKIESCISNNKYVLYNSNTPIPLNEPIIYNGRYYRLTTYNKKLNYAHIKNRLFAQSGIYNFTPPCLKGIIVHQGGYGYLEKINGNTSNSIKVSKSNKISGFGWIINQTTQTTPDSVYIILKQNGVSKYYITTNLVPRQDVAKAMGQYYLNSGYTFTIYGDLLLPGEYSISIIFLTKHKVFELNSGKHILIK